MLPEVERTIAGVSGAKLLLSAGALLAAFAAYIFVPLFHEHPLLLWIAVLVGNSESTAAGLLLLWHSARRNRFIA